MKGSWRALFGVWGVVQTTFAWGALPLSVAPSSAPSGWNWYKDPAVPKAPKPEGKKASASSKPQTAREKMAALRRQFEESLEAAILDPTLKTVQKAQGAQREMMRKASQFEEMWMLVSLLNGDESRASDQTNLLYRKLFEAEQEKVVTAALRKVARTHGLFLLVKKDCPYCKAFASVVRDFAQSHGFSVVGVSRDGARVPGITPLPDNGMVEKLNPRGFYPALFLVPYDGASPPLPLAWGMVSGSDLRDNAKRLLQVLGASRETHG